MTNDPSLCSLNKVAVLCSTSAISIAWTTSWTVNPAGRDVAMVTGGAVAVVPHGEEMMIDGRRSTTAPSSYSVSSTKPLESSMYLPGADSSTETRWALGGANSFMHIAAA